MGVANHTSATVKVISNYTYSGEYTLEPGGLLPGFFTYQSNGNSIASALDASYTEITSSHPVPRGTLVQLYMNGLGPVNNQPADGWPAKTRPQPRPPTL